MKRKKFISLSSASIVLLTTGAFALNHDVNQKILLETETLGNVWRHSTIVRIGNFYRNQFPGENYSNILMNCIPERLINSEDVSKCIKEKILEEHNSNDTVLIDGWLVSKTEGCKCALISIKYS